MTDIGLHIVNGCIDLLVEDGNLKRDIGLETAVLISVFSDQRVSFSELPQGLEDSDRRGYWGDEFATVEGDRTGSKNWLHLTGKADNFTAAAIETRTRNSLKWFVDDGIAKSVFASAEFDTSGILRLNFGLVKPDGRTHSFAFLWDGQKLQRG